MAILDPDGEQFGAWAGSDLDIPLIRARADAATEGPWDLDTIAVYMSGGGQYRIGPRGKPGVVMTTFRTHPDAVFIAAARTDVVALLDEVERLRAVARPGLGDLHERLAAIEHERWAHWQRWMHDQCPSSPVTGDRIIPAHLIARWERQIATPYADLTEAEKASDREQVDRYWPLIEQLATERDAYRAVVDAARAWRTARLRQSHTDAAGIVATIGALDAAVDALPPEGPEQSSP